MSRSKAKGLLTLGVLVGITLFIISPRVCIEASVRGLRVWGLNVLPALFPFFILTRIIIAVNQTSIPVLDKFTTKCFRTSNAGLVYFLSILSGYPVGAKLISNYYQTGAIDKNTASKMFSFCSTSGPMFIVGTVGIGVFGDARVGYVLLIGHILGGFLNGLLYRGKTIPINQFSPTITKTNLNDIMFDSINSIFMVGGYIIFSSVIIELLTLTKLLPAFANILSCITHLDYDATYSFVCGLLEITNGLIMLGGTNITLNLKIILSTILISFSGLCIMLQSNGFLNTVGIKKSTMLIKKLTQTIFSVLITILIITIIY